MFDRDCWAASFNRTAVPKYPCPRCKAGRLIFDPAALRLEEPKYSKDAVKSPDWEPDWEVIRFSAQLRCNEEPCGEIVVLLGDTELIEIVDDDGDWGLYSALRPRAMFPAPPVIRIASETPESVKNEIEKAFFLIWSDMNAAANRLRVSVEKMMDHFKVPRQASSKKTGNPYDLDLNGRIALFNKTSPEHSDSLTAMRMIGNLGSHGSGVSRAAILDAFEVYEDCLSEIFGQRTQRLAALKQKIISSKGKYGL